MYQYAIRPGGKSLRNMSYSDAGKLYELIQVGDPVIMHY